MEQSNIIMNRKDSFNCSNIVFFIQCGVKCYSERLIKLYTNFNPRIVSHKTFLVLKGSEFHFVTLFEE